MTKINDNLGLIITDIMIETINIIGALTAILISI